MPGLEFFDREIKIATQGLELDQINKALAAYARQELAKAIAAGAPRQYQRFVNGHEGAAEESVVAPGPITYLFVNWGVVIPAALDELKKRSPRRTGRYMNSFVVVVGGRTVVTDYSKIRPDGEVIIFNAYPSTRKIETGNNGPGARHFDLARRALNSRFKGAFEVEMKYVDVPGGVAPGAPYILKRTTKRRSAGTPLTYPTLIINAAP
jgi:hypothetical protein